MIASMSMMQLPYSMIRLPTYLMSVSFHESKNVYTRSAIYIFLVKHLCKIRNKNITKRVNSDLQKCIDELIRENLVRSVKVPMSLVGHLWI